MKFETIRWEGGAADGTVVMIDQTRLPGALVYLRIDTAEGMRHAIRRLSVRGAPAIGIAAAYGFILGIRPHARASRETFDRAVEDAARLIASSRPTAQNLFHALDRVSGAARQALEAGEPPDALEAAWGEAVRIHREDAEMCEAIGRHGAAIVPDPARIHTHCNAGALATGGIGTALGVIYAAAGMGKKVRVWADETRPLLQGARLTAWELRESGIDVTLIPDGAAAWIMKREGINIVIVGADRIARNGDVANKIGTYGLAVAAKEHGVPFYVAAPSTTFDPAIGDGSEIPIEERSVDEVTGWSGVKTAPDGIQTSNPAFDVTPARFLSGIITERGIIRPPFEESIPGTLGWI